VAVVPADFSVASHEILPRLFLGDLSAACDPDEVEATALSHIVSTVGVERMRERGLRYFTFCLNDTPEAPIHAYLSSAHAWIDAALAASPMHRILVHCVAGVSRSATVVISYVMHARRLRLREAFHLVQRRRTIVDPNPGFQAVLMQFDQHLFSGGSWPPEGAVAAVCDARVDAPAGTDLAPSAGATATS